MHMKSTHAADTSSARITGPTRSHIISRLHKATIYANQLATVLREASTGSTDLIEARAYSCTLAGALHFEKQKWEDCLTEYSAAKIIYETLATASKKEAPRYFLSDPVDPSIRYAAYQLKFDRKIGVDTIAIRHFPRSDTELVNEVKKIDPDALDQKAKGAKKGGVGEVADAPTSITWRSRTVDIEDAAIAQALAAVNNAEKQLTVFLQDKGNQDSPAKIKAAAYDNVIIASQDAVDATKTAIDDLAAEGISQSDKRMQSLQVTRTAVNYALVGWRIGRNRILCGGQDGKDFESEQAQVPRKPRKDGKPFEPKEEGTGRKLARLRERVVLYDSTLQSLDFVKALPGVAADGTFLQELEGKRTYFQALK